MTNIISSYDIFNSCIFARVIVSMKNTAALQALTDPSGTLSWTPLNSLSLYHQYRCFSFESLRCIVFVADLCFLEELLEAPESAQDQLKDLGDGFVWGNYSTLNQHSTIWLFLNYWKSQEVEIWRPLAWNFWRDGVLFYLFLERYYVSFLVMMFLDNQGAFPAVGLRWWRDCWRRRVLWRCVEGRGSSSDTDSAVLKWTITDSLADKDKLVFC